MEKSAALTSSLSVKITGEPETRRALELSATSRVETWTMMSEVGVFVKVLVKREDVIVSD